MKIEDGNKTCIELSLPLLAFFCRQRLEENVILLIRSYLEL